MGSRPVPFISGSNSPVEIRFHIDPKKEPKVIREEIVSAGNKGFTRAGIYRIMDGTLEMCFNIDPKSKDVPPKEFGGETGSKQMHITLKREKK
jgi:uncharacterized protein (TIGR03067 family)